MPQMNHLQGVMLAVVWVAAASPSGLQPPATGPVLPAVQLAAPKTASLAAQLALHLIR
jgi:hypothetical protein